MLGAGFCHGPVVDYLRFDWDYDLMISYRLGEELNKSTIGSLYSRAKIAVFYPAPFDRRNPAWTKHFVAYVNGATDVKDFNKRTLEYNE
jgi:hypothetical protein